MENTCNNAQHNRLFYVRTYRKSDVIARISLLPPLIASIPVKSYMQRSFSTYRSKA